MGVQLTIISAQASELAEQLAAATGESLTEAVIVALRERLQALSRDAEAGTPPRGEASKARSEAAEPPLHAPPRGKRGRWNDEILAADHGELPYEDDTAPPA